MRAMPEGRIRDIRVRDIIIAIGFAVPIGLAARLALSMPWYYGWPFAILCCVVLQYAANIVQDWLLKKLTAEEALRQQQEKNSN
jgi:hypothetical protein